LGIIRREESNIFPATLCFQDLLAANLSFQTISYSLLYTVNMGQMRPLYASGPAIVMSKVTAALANLCFESGILQMAQL